MPIIATIGIIVLIAICLAVLVILLMRADKQSKDRMKGSFLISQLELLELCGPVYPNKSKAKEILKTKYPGLDNHLIKVLVEDGFKFIRESKTDVELEVECEVIEEDAPIIFSKDATLVPAIDKTISQEALKDIINKHYPNKLLTVKEVKNIFGIGLKEAKDLVDSSWDTPEYMKNLQQPVKVESDPFASRPDEEDEDMVIKSYYKSIKNNGDFTGTN